ncbi:MAG: tRNA pseudouridine(38-40) synthase TruA [Candidatus Gastranaerophilales bacterium]|nr:tRNA pseudouridine(38-40) synthase TruA [Candidatus Gastranaerophilales bacterium]
MQRFVLVIEYIGTNYAGSQTQGARKSKDKAVTLKTDKNPNPPKTIQDEIEKTLSTLTKKPIKTFFSGRTDAGVHSKGQIIHFDSDFDCLNPKFINSMNGLLPKDISIKKIKEVPKNFHAQKSATARWYRYKIVNRNQRSAWDENCLFVRDNLNVDKMNEALSYLVGEHDFSTFKKVKTLNPAKVCTMYKAQCFRNNDEIYIDLIANRFLYNMVRSIVGTLLMIERNSLAPSALKEILNSKDRNQAGPTISPNGLTLMKVIYNNEKYGDSL